MYVRWKVRTRAYKPKWWERETDKLPKLTRTAVLVSSERVDGKPRQRIVAYLGSIDDRYRAEVSRRRHFWSNVNRHLDALALPPDQRERIERSIAAVVPAPTAEEIEQDRREWEAIFSRARIESFKLRSGL